MVFKSGAYCQKRPGQVADLAVARAHGRSGMGAFFAIDPGDILLVLHQGRVRPCDEYVQVQLPQRGMDFGQYGQLMIGNRIIGNKIK